MNPSSIQPSAFQFLTDLAANNNRDWFARHKDRYQASLDNMVGFADALLAEMNKHDLIETPSGKKALFRIYNDVRFSKDKSPYNARFAMSFRRANKEKRGGYYLNLKPGNCFLACGFFNPNPEDLRRIRFDIDDNYEDWQKILRSKAIKSTYGDMQGNTVATAPRGYTVDHPGIDLLRHKSFVFRHTFTDDEVLTSGFHKSVSQTFKTIRPWLDYMSEVLTTDRNGVPLP
ncbi:MULTISPECIES: DUF2461 domain-containing protein [unclassified Imperialibacter]|uniref:DUF2461 domain-containing protein n=1 Tax=unclassified Imperialibacter TaxID=2629706 RepID=UPI0012524690|nr:MULTISPECIES: DUF2461 domain-containing protein [unclassified Imperialibacter]CAD5252665.1 conserved hypothetical protein [Imperialibacter sp. 75]CAD5280856.1 conserved hypothetical protein [Imperialibacter sp. 89]VVT28806.1 conserved hypothetical protein [Imperialibacter sp. EC-SDR9]